MRFALANGGGAAAETSPAELPRITRDETSVDNIFRSTVEGECK
jgi:hypothetical protein